MSTDTTYRPVSLVERFVAALRLDRQLFAEAAVHRQMLGQALMVVVIGGVMSGTVLVQYLGNVGVWAGIMVAVVTWFAWTAILQLLAPLFRASREGRSLLRPLGFAAAPNLLLALGLVAELAYVSRIVVVLWLMAATVVAVEVVYRVGRWKAVALALTAFVIYLIVGVVVEIGLDVLTVWNTPMPPAQDQAAPSADATQS